MSVTPDEPGEQPEIGYEQARSELMDVVARLESGEADLADAMKLWDRGMYLASVCQRWLDGAKARIEAARPDEA
ncbi:MAG: exodeoxyribonuclease VII small subunit [Propionibacteriaceae bacterium]|nr:exodeoxyribonuclease VII small subunit [Propionibacteriaceae bacterium]